jgi:hypothetical protein
MLALTSHADSVELKLTVPDSAHRSTVAALDMDPLDGQIRLVFFFDTPDLRLNQCGVVVRGRRVQGRGAARCAGHAMGGLLALVPAASFAFLGLGVRRASPCSRSSGAGGVHCRNVNPAARGSWSVGGTIQGELMRKPLPGRCSSDPVSSATLSGNECLMCRSLYQHRSRNIGV